MSFPRALVLRRLAARNPAVCRTAFPAAGVRWTSSKPGDGDLGGPGGQEPIPSNSGVSQSWPTLAAIAGAGLLVGGYLVHLTGRPRAHSKVEGGQFDKLADKVTPSK